MRYWIELLEALPVRYLVLLAAVFGSLLSTAFMSASSRKIFRVIGLSFYIALMCSAFYILFRIIRQNCMGY